MYSRKPGSRSKNQTEIDRAQRVFSARQVHSFGPNLDLFLLPTARPIPPRPAPSRHPRKTNPQSCALECEGYAFFGTQYGDECWCGGNETDHLQHGESELCDFKCAGDASQVCGGYFSLSVYQYASATTTGGQEEEEEGGPVVQPTTSTSSGGASTTTDAIPECDGVLSPLGYYCCASSCGTCGGTGCGGREGGAAACCTNNIKAAGDKCEATGGAAPCVVDEYLG